MPQSSMAPRLRLSEVLGTYPTVNIPSTIQCGGNRAGDLSQIAPTNFYNTPFENIGVGMMGNGVWSGVRLRTVLLDHFPQLAEMTDQELACYHVEFIGADDYATSTPLARILDPEMDCLLATHLNQEPLSRDHGFPVRVLLPGLAGCRDVKWLRCIRIQRDESSSCFQKTYYLDPHGRAIQEMPQQSFMTSKTRLNDTTWRVQGVAWGGGRGVHQVQVSANGGASWVKVHKLQSNPRLDAHRSWGWVSWECDVASKSTNPSLVCRMTDGDGLPQPEKSWYHRGYLCNVWHRL